MSLNALNSSAFPVGSKKNIVACSPVCPLNRIYGSMTNLISRSLQSLSQLFPLLHLQHHPIVRHRDAMAIHGVVVRFEFPVLANIRIQVTDELVPEQIEIHPGLAATSFATTDDLGIKLSCLCDVPPPEWQCEKVSAS